MAARRLAADIFATATAARDQVRQRDEAMLQELARAYLAGRDRLNPQFDRLLRTVEERAEAGEVLTNGEALRVWRDAKVERQILEELTELSNETTGVIERKQVQDFLLANKDVQALVNAALPRGIDLRTLQRIGVNWQELATSSIEGFVGTMRNGATLNAYLQATNIVSVKRVRDELVAGLTSGRSPRVTAAKMRSGLGLSLTRALRIARTETLRSYREASRANYGLNSGIVKGWERLSARDDRTCAACWALDGTFYEVEDPGDFHVSCRCVMVPVTVTYEDLGLNVPEGPRRIPDAREAFEELPDKSKQQILGRRGAESLAKGEVGLDDFVHRDRSRIWGESARQAGLGEAKRNAARRAA